MTGGRPVLRIEPTDRMFIAGQTGSGKSTVGSLVAARWSRVLVYDPKVDPVAAIPNATIAYGYKAARAALPGRVVYRPLPREKHDVPGIMDDLARVVYLHGAHGLVIHELGDLALTDRELGPFVSACWRQGRSRRVPVVALSQRPVNVPLMALSEASHVLAFYLKHRADRERMAEFMGPDVVTAPVGPDHSFYYLAPDLTLSRCEPFRL